MQTDPQDVKARLLLAAKKLFSRKGFDGTSIREICEEAGANVALVSYHFGGKDKIFQALFETYFPTGRVREVLDRPGEPIEGLRLIVREVTMYRNREPEMINLFQQEILLASPRMATIQKYAFPIWEKLRDFLAEGKRKGVFHFRSLDHTFFSVLGVILFHKQSDYFGSLRTEPIQSEEQLIEDLTDFILNALKV